MTQQQVTASRGCFRMEIIPDNDPDPSYLEQDGFEDRLAEWKRCAFGFVGVRASIEVEIPFSHGSILHTVTSPGLWGIEDDSGQDYFREVFTDESAILVDMLEKLGVEVQD